MPTPDPLWIAPGKALVGLPVWLETNRNLHFDVPAAGLTAMPGGMVSVTAEAYFTVDWDDDSPHAEADNNQYRYEGIPPEPETPDAAGGITHNYTVVPDSGEVTITVTDYWTVEFEDQWGRTATVEGTLDESISIPVIELQAVITD